METVQGKPINIDTTRIYAQLTEAVQKGYTTISLQGSARSGKTYNTILWLIIFGIQNPGIRIAVVRGTLPALRSSVFLDFKDNLSRLGFWSEKDLNKTTLTYKLPSRSVFEFFSADNEQKLRGRKRDILFVNEANELTFLEFQQLKLRTTRFTIIDYNPSFSDDHWISTDVNRDPRTYRFISTYKDNPFLEKTVIDEIESLQLKNQSLWTIYGLGLQAQVEGVVFTNWDIVDEFPTRIKPQYIGIDFGFTHDQTAIIRVAKDGDDLFLEEIEYSTEMLTTDIIKVLKANTTKGQNIISESADPRLVQEIHNAGLNIYPVKKGSGSVQAGIMYLQQLRIHVTAKSTNAIKELKNYTYTQDKDGKWLDVPIDSYNHILDALRYVAMERYLGVKTIKPIDKKKLAGNIY